MPIYEKPVRLLLKDFVAAQDVAKEQIIARDQVLSWFRENYPKIKMGTINAHFLKMSVNAPSRIHYNVNPNGDDDLFYQIDGGHFRLYEEGKDPSPIYVKSLPGNGEEDETDKSDENDEKLPHKQDLLMKVT